jgi:GntR family transcriptional regulator
VPLTSDSAPAYRRIADSLRDRIGSSAPNTLIPSERELSEMYGVSRMTARKAVDLLEGEGFVYRRPPRGTFVAEPRLTLRIGSFSDEITRLGHTPDAAVLSAAEVAPSALVRDALSMSTEAAVYAIERLRSVDGEPVAIERTFIPAALAPGLLDHDLGFSLWELLRKEYDIQPDRASARIECQPLDEVVSRRLGVRHASSGIVLTRHTYGADGRCIEYATDIYRADRTAFLVSEPIPPPT